MGTSDPISIELLLQHDSWLRALATRLARDTDEAEELLQETWLAALRRPPIQRATDVRGWLKQVAYDEAGKAAKPYLRFTDGEEKIVRRMDLELVADQTLEVFVE